MNFIYDNEFHYDNTPSPSLRSESPLLPSNPLYSSNTSLHKVSNMSYFHQSDATPNVHSDGMVTYTNIFVSLKPFCSNLWAVFHETMFE